MRYLKSFNKLNEEVSKNEPIPELYQKNKLGIFLLGIPGSGKSTFIKNEIMTKNRNFKSFSTDYVSLKFTGDPNVFFERDKDGSKITATDVNLMYLENYMKSGQNFVFDTTGDNEEAIVKINKLALENGYNVIFIVMLIESSEAKKRNILRGEKGGHLVPDDYIEQVYNNQREKTKKYIKNLNYENFYVVLVKDRGFKYYKHTGNDLLVHKNDKYVPRKKSRI
jgi:predicted ABC-type ATPase